MGNLPWKSSLSGSSTTTGKRHPNAAHDDETRRQAIYRMLTEDINPVELAAEFNVSSTALYNWRSELISPTAAKKYEVLARAFIEKYAKEIGEEPKQLIIRRTLTPSKKTTAKKTTAKRRQYSPIFKREAVHRLVNRGEKVQDIAIELKVSEAHVYAWRQALLGRTTDKDFIQKARDLAREFVNEARASDLVDGANDTPTSAPDEPMSFEPMPSSGQLALPEPSRSPATFTSGVNGIAISEQRPDVILSSIQEIDAKIETLQKDRKLLVQQLEIMKLRRELARAGHSS